MYPMTTKAVLGEIAEQKFTVRAIEEGFKVSRPIGHITSYDFIIEKEGRLFRIQVKSTHQIRKGNRTFQISVGQSSLRVSKPYADNSFDYFAIFVGPLDCFFIVPQSAIKVRTLSINPAPNKNRYVEYLENWEI